MRFITRRTLWVGSARGVAIWISPAGAHSKNADPLATGPFLVWDPHTHQRCNLELQSMNGRRRLRRPTPCHHRRNFVEAWSVRWLSLPYRLDQGFPFIPGLAAVPAGRPDKTTVAQGSAPAAQGSTGDLDEAFRLTKRLSAGAGCLRLPRQFASCVVENAVQSA